MNGKLILFIDQYGNREYATTLRDLRAKCGGGRVFKIYRDKKDGRTMHCGYGVGRRWFDMFAPIELAAS